MGRKAHVAAETRYHFWVWWAVAWLVAAVAGCVDHTAPTYPYEKEPNPLEREYVVGVADALAVRVYQHEEFNAEMAVRPDGNITLPLIGDVRAAGRTPTELKQDIVDKLKAYIKDVIVVTVAVNAVNSYYVTVSGRVNAPGRITSQSYLSVGDAIALAGGPDKYASSSDVFVLRKDERGTRKIPVNYEQLVRGEHLQQNILLMRGDQVIVP